MESNSLTPILNLSLLTQKLNVSGDLSAFRLTNRHGSSLEGTSHTQSTLASALIMSQSRDHVTSSDLDFFASPSQWIPWRAPPQNTQPVQAFSRAYVPQAWCQRQTSKKWVLLPHFLAQDQVPAHPHWLAITITIALLACPACPATLEDGLILPSTKFSS